MKTKTWLWLVIGWLGVVGAQGEALNLPLGGHWRFALDPNGQGEPEKWFSKDLADRIDLPGTTDLARKGHALRRDSMTYGQEVLRTQWPGTVLPARADETGTLIRDWLYIGKAWYQRDIDITAAWQGKRVQLRLERALWRTKVWLDERFIGTEDSLVAEHRFDLGGVAPGRHRLTICVDNSLQHNIGIIGHSYGPETQGRWNGLVGDLRLIATDPVFVRQVQAFPAADRRSVLVKVQLENSESTAARADLRVAISNEKGRELGYRLARINLQPGEGAAEQTVTLAQPAEAWDEFQTTRYRVTARVQAGLGSHTVEQNFGFRQVERDGRQIRVNGRRIFLRGTLDCCVYPNTGHPPLKVEEWLKVMGVIKEYGFNHVRFHSWCPPEAAFEAADRLGLYVLPETPFWVDNWTVKTGSLPKLFGQDPDAVDYVVREIRRISEAYGNHPSFAFFCIGNEFGMDSDWRLLNQVLAEAKARDNRRLYSASTARKRTAADDYWLTHSTGRQGTRGVGPARTDWDFRAAAQESELPVIAHETGQRPVFPDYGRLLPKFTGPLRPYNLERLRRLLDVDGLAGQVPEFTRASARFQMVQYKAEHEGMLRTPDYAGYQLLMLNDFTGQSEALVGILDPFWQSKGVVTAQEVRRWNAPTVILARFKGYTWAADQTFKATLEVAHYGATDQTSAVGGWSLSTAGHQVIAQGTLGPLALRTGGLTQLGEVAAGLSPVTKPCPLVLRASVARSTNEWTIWVYPPRETNSSQVTVVRRFDEQARRALADGKRVLMLAQGLKNSRTARVGFGSVYWSAGWGGNQFSSLGLLCHPAHPALRGFPNAGHGDWQWQPLVQNATAFSLAGAPAGYRPIVQTVPDFHYSRLVGLVFETRVGSGSLLVCGLNLEGEDPAAKAMKNSLIDYLGSPDFSPATQFSAALLDELLADGASDVMRRSGARVMRADSAADGFEAAKILDGSAETFWHTPWEGQAPGFPHTVEIDLGKTTSIQGLKLLPRQDGNPNGWIKDYEIYLVDQLGDWGKPVARGSFTADARAKVIQFKQAGSGRYLKFVALGSFQPSEPFASLAELEVIATK
jgi:hypothetical protein